MKGLLQFLTNIGTDFFRETVLYFRECLMIQHSPDHPIIKSKITANMTGNTVIGSTTVMDVKEAEIREYTQIIDLFRI